MAINIVNYIRERIKSIDSSIDTRPGSVVSDLLINPITSILSSYGETQDVILRNQTLEDLSSISESEMDTIVTNFLITRENGAKSTGTVKLYFNEPRTLAIARGTQFSDSTGTLIYETLADYSITRGTMEITRDQFPLYNTEPIQIQGILAGSDYNQPANAITRALTLQATPAKINNSQPIVSGEDKEDNESLFTRLLLSFADSSLSSTAGIKRQLLSNFLNLNDVEVVGAGDPLMQRDLMENLSLAVQFKEEDFYLVQSGLHTYPWKQHIAYTASIIDTDDSEMVSLPEPDGFTTEFSQGLYEGLFFKSDVSYAQQDEYVILQEFFEDLNNPDIQLDLQTVLASGYWEIHDGLNPDNSIFYIDEVNTQEGYLRLGKTLDYSNLDDSILNIPYSTINTLLSLATEAITVVTTNNEETDYIPVSDDTEVDSP
ncbi:hypothetical protein HN682_07660 [Candidatus Peregrinibacteria bacterium]|jgi:hypothetical protein|nr:hypothetical protein [Candidatus Peregrinibacteria bacterium]